MRSLSLIAQGIASTNEATVGVAIERLAGTWPTYGYRRIIALLQREGFQINHMHVTRLRREMGLQGQVLRAGLGRRRATMRTRATRTRCRA